MSSKSIAYDVSAAIALETAIQMLISEIFIFVVFIWLFNSQQIGHH